MPTLYSARKNFHKYGPWTWEVEFEVDGRLFGCQIDPRTGERQLLLSGGLYWEVE